MEINQIVKVNISHVERYLGLIIGGLDEELLEVLIFDWQGKPSTEHSHCMMVERDLVNALSSFELMRVCYPSNPLKDMA